MPETTIHAKLKDALRKSVTREAMREVKSVSVLRLDVRAAFPIRGRNSGNRVCTRFVDPACKTKVSKCYTF
jgi:hypothetical protein